MAFGFAREAGAARGYINVSNPDLPIGTRLSRRQYDKYVERLGARTRTGGAAAIGETERLLEQVRRDLASRQAILDAREAGLNEREAALREQETDLARKLNRLVKTSKGQRRLNAALEGYVRFKRDQGIKITKIEARKSPEFKEALRKIKGIPNPDGNPFIAAQNKRLRFEGLEAIGGGNYFADVYKALYGVSAPAGRFRGVDATGRSTGRGNVRRRA